MASRVPDSPPDWRLPILTSKFYASKCSSPPNGPQQMFASKCFTWDKFDSLQVLGLPMVPTVGTPPMQLQRGHLELPAQLTSDTGLIISEAWQFASLFCMQVKCDLVPPVFVLFPRAIRGQMLHMGPMGHSKFWASQCLPMVPTSA